MDFKTDPATEKILGRLKRAIERAIFIPGKRFSERQIRKRIERILTHASKLNWLDFGHESKRDAKSMADAILNANKKSAG